MGHPQLGSGAWGAVCIATTTLPPSADCHGRGDKGYGRTQRGDRVRPGRLRAAVQGDQGRIRPMVERSYHRRRCQSQKRTPPPPTGWGQPHGGMARRPLQGGGGGQGKPRLAAAVKRTMHTRSLGLSTPSKSKPGRGVAGNSRAGKAPPIGLARSAVSCDLFALGITRSTLIATLPQEEGQGRASTPPRGSEAPGKSHGSSTCEDT